MTTPLLAMDSPYGRLYRHPSTPAESLPGVEQALAEGLLMPSVTNVIGVLDKPHLAPWYARRAAAEAVSVSQSHPNLIADRPDKAHDYLASAAPRHVQAAQRLGDEVHTAIENELRGATVNFSVKAAPYMAAFRRFVEDFSPEFLHLETTCFGTVTDPQAGPLRYAGTADFIARINGVTVIGDWKTGRSIHTEAGLQVASLAHATEMVDDDLTSAALPDIQTGLIVHLSRTGYAVRQAPVDGLGWQVFCRLRSVWDFHVANLASRQPLLMGRPVRDPAQIVAGGTDPVAGALSSGLLR